MALKRSARHRRKGPRVVRHWLLPSAAQAVFFEVFLRIDVGLGRYHADLTTLHSHSLQECAHAIWTPFDSGQLFDLRHRFLDAGGGMLAKIGLDRGAVVLQITAWTPESQGFQRFDSTLPIFTQVLSQRRRANIRQSTNILVWQPMAFQPKSFHLALDKRMRMVETLATQRGLVAVAEFDLDHRRLSSGKRIRLSPLNR